MSYKTNRLAKHPWCVLCGGVAPAVNVDHLPPKQMFDLKLRPKGMECPTCRACNNEMGVLEAVPALIRRMPKENAPAPQQAETEKLFRSVIRNFPGLLEVMFAEEPKGQVAFGEAVKIPPMLHGIVTAFAAKLCVGLHWLHTGRIVPTTGKVAVSWYTNYNAAQGTLPIEVIRLLGAAQTLRQGKFTVGDQFYYQQNLVPSLDAGIYWAVFRPSFAVIAFLHEEGSRMKKVPLTTYSPGQWPTLSDIQKLPLRKSEE